MARFCLAEPGSVSRTQRTTFVPAEGSAGEGRPPAVRVRVNPRKNYEILHAHFCTWVHFSQWEGN
jgi:hypothetical protein